MIYINSFQAIFFVSYSNIYGTKQEHTWKIKIYVGSCLISLFII